MDERTSIDQPAAASYVSTGHLPSPERCGNWCPRRTSATGRTLTARTRDVYPALARVPSELFGVCVVGTSGEVYAVGDTDYEFSIMSVSKPFVFALVCQEIGAEAAREKLGANATGMPFNSLGGRRTQPRTGGRTRW